MKPQDEIKKIRHEVDDLMREKGLILEKISKKRERLKTLLIMTDNQINMDDIEGFQNT